MTRQRPADRPRRKAKAPARPRKGEAADPATAFCRAVDDALRDGRPTAISDEALQRVFTAAVKLYAAKAEESGESLLPFGANAVTATEAAVASCGIMRAADLNLFDMAMWFRRPLPEV